MTQVVSIQEEFQALNTSVITLSFGTPYWAQMWLQETQSPFPFLIDPERISYKAYGLESSVFRSWSPRNLWYYAWATLQKRETFGKRGNPHQLGGDFIVDQRGILRLIHPSSDPTDRPPIDKILSILHSLQR